MSIILHIIRVPSFLLIASLFLLLGCQPDQKAITDQWTLVPEQSHISLFSVKAQSVGETFTIALNKGSISETGDVQIEFFPGNIETGIEIRNSRMAEYFFEVTKWPTATVTTQIDFMELSKINTNESHNFSSDITVTLHGISKTYNANFTIRSLSNNQVLVQSTKPISVHADDFNLASGLTKLQELAGLSSITPVVPVNFTLVFESN